MSKFCNDLYNSTVWFFSWLVQLKRNKQYNIWQAEQDNFNRLAQDELKEFQSFQKKFAEYQQKVSELQFNFESQENFKPILNLAKLNQVLTLKKEN